MNLIRRSLKTGFSLVEIMIVVAIIGILMTMGVRYYTGYKGKANLMGAKVDLRDLQRSIGSFYDDIGQYPRALEDLVSRPGWLPNDLQQKWGEGMPEKDKTYFAKSKKMKKDPWGNPYVYSPNPDGDNPYTLYSHGPEKGGKFSKISVWSLE